ncbi:MAG: flagellar motor switch phosphatase FliY [Lachnospiraceae bacterium]|nr:flagellar motor switch phosphatase FliY [Lachnospiraceae bacterium]MDE6698015.1 flagellar motor switch phosphatase FliY [Lachnospiraceae bacterium]
MDGMLSQDEINALLNGMDTEDSSESNDSKEVTVEYLSAMEKDTMGEISNISMGTAATTLSSLVNQKVDITTPSVNFSNWNDLVSSYDRPCVFLQISYKEGLNGNNMLILRENDVKIIADLMMGGDGTNTDGELGELHLSAIAEAMNQMMGSASTSLSSMLGTKIDISPPIADLVDLNEVMDVDEVSDFFKEDFVKISFRMTIGDLVDSEIMQLFPIEFCKTLCNKFGVGDESAASEPAPAPVQEAPQPQQIQQPQQPQQPMDQQPQGMPNGYGQPMQGMPNGYGMPQGQGMPNMGMPNGYGQPMQGMPAYGMPYGMPMQEVNVQPVQFQAFSPDLVAVNQRENINLIMDVPLEVTVELGHTTKSIQDILEFSPGTIIELNKIAGEPIDVLVNGKYVAKGEVVVIEESFGVRVTEIIK